MARTRERKRERERERECVCVRACVCSRARAYANLINVIESLYSKATSAVYYNGSVGEWFRTTAGVRQGCLLSPTLFNIFLERIMTDALENHEGSVSIGGRTITNLRFADDIDALAGKQGELVKLIWIRPQQNMAWRSVQKRLS